MKSGNLLTGSSRYAVIGYGVKLNTIQKDEWVYTFRLRREDGQPSLEKALRHPTAEEYSGWKAYKKDKEGREEARVSPTTPLAELVSPVKDMVKRPAEEDEGYFSVLGQQ